MAIFRHFHFGSDPFHDTYTRAMASFEKTILAINDLKASGIIDQYAIAGAMALMFWIEPVPTFDLDVLVSRSILYPRRAPQNDGNARQLFWSQRTSTAIDSMR